MSVAQRASDVPVLVIAWRRPELTSKVLDAVAAWKPTRLFLACDGWNADSPPELVARVGATRSVMDRVPEWPCEVQRRYADGNAGLRAGVVAALDWFFAACPEGIVLEDDCVPSPEFGAYCAELLERYRDDPRVMCVSGDGSSGIVPPGGASYSFVRYPLIWGWASWRSSWAHFARDLARTSALSETEWEALVPDAVERRVWKERLGALIAPTPFDTWDAIWALSMILRGGLCILPRANLTTNIGVGADATHTFTLTATSAVGTASILPLRHRAFVEEDTAASHRLFYEFAGGEGERRRFAWERTFRGRVRRRLHRSKAFRWATTRLSNRLRRQGKPPWLRP
jgi:hypothetical protein